MQAEGAGGGVALLERLPQVGDYRGADQHGKGDITRHPLQRRPVGAQGEHQHHAYQRIHQDHPLPDDTSPCAGPRPQDQRQEDDVCFSNIFFSRSIILG